MLNNEDHYSLVPHFKARTVYAIANSVQNNTVPTIRGVLDMALQEDGSGGRIGLLLMSVIRELTYEVGVLF